MLPARVRPFNFRFWTVRRVYHGTSDILPNVSEAGTSIAARSWAAASTPQRRPESNGSSSFTHRHTRALQEVRPLIFNRDNYTCQLCGHFTLAEMAKRTVLAVY